MFLTVTGGQCISVIVTGGSVEDCVGVEAVDEVAEGEVLSVVEMMGSVGRGT